MRLATVALCLLTVLCCSVSAQERMATVSGHCYLLDEVDHSGTKIVFFAQSPTAQTDSTYTDVNGYYNMGVVEGLYQIRYTHDGYLPRYDNRLLDEGSHVLADVTLLGPALVVSGQVSGEWGVVEKYYLVEDDIEVPIGNSLLMHPGVTVFFEDDCRFDVLGALSAIGTGADSIRMRSVTRPAPPGAWGPLAVADSISVSLEHCVVRDVEQITASYHSDLCLLRSVVRNAADYAIQCTGVDELVVSECVIDSCLDASVVANAGRHILLESTRIDYWWGEETSGGGAVGIYDIRGAAEIRSCVVHGDGLDSSPWYVEGISARGDTVVVEGCSVSGRFYSGIEVAADSTAAVLNCVVSGTWRNGIVLGGYARDNDVIRNTVVGGYPGIKIWSETTEATISMNLVAECGDGILCDAEDVSFGYNDLWDNTTDYAGTWLPTGIGVPITVNANGDSCDAYYNISMDPLFVAPDDYHLQEGSPCIDAGDPDPIYYDPDDTIADIGAYPYFQYPADPPEIDFSVSGTFGTSPYPVQFTSTNTGGPITSWLWDFGGGGSSAVAHPSHTYLVSDTTSFTVALTVQGPGGQDTVVYPDLITVLPPEISPDADFAGVPTVGYGPVQFTDLSTGQIEEWEWDFGDSGTSTEQHPYHDYAAPGTFTVSLTVTGAYGVDTEIKPDYITIVPPETVIAGFIPSVTGGVAPLHVWFDNTSTGTITEYAWDFGDSATSTDFEPTHTYTEEGLYEVVLVATGPANSDTASAFISVESGEPAITSVEDVPADYGGQVYVRFTRSGHDTDGPRSGEGYTVERRDDGEWVAVASGAAYGQPDYVYLAPTLVDSTEGDPGLTEFRVVASMDEGSFLSDPAWGYSVDNLTPTPEPLITSISDVPDDQGGQAYLRFRRSEYDTGVLGGRDAESYTVERRDDGIWTGIMSTAAYGQHFYQVLVQTLVDSTPGDPGLTEFRVVAAMDEGNFLSDPAWGYSIDNIAPAPPGGLAAEGGMDSVSLTWIASGEEDFSRYAVYRDTVEWFEPGEPIGYTVEESYEDTGLPVASHLWYRVTAIDLHENESAPSGAVTSAGTGVTDAVMAFRLGSAVPNPFNPVTEVSYSVPAWAAGTPHALVVYDVTGRRVRTLVDGPSLPGQQTAIWDGRDDSGAAVSSGVYLYRLEAAGFRAERKMVLLK